MRYIKPMRSTKYRKQSTRHISVHRWNHLKSEGVPGLSSIFNRAYSLLFFVSPLCHFLHSSHFMCVFYAYLNNEYSWTHGIVYIFQICSRLGSCFFFALHLAIIPSPPNAIEYADFRCAHSTAPSDIKTCSMFDQTKTSKWKWTNMVLWNTLAFSSGILVFKFFFFLFTVLFSPNCCGQRIFCIVPDSWNHCRMVVT